MSEFRPLPTYLFKNKTRPPLSRTEPSLFFEISMTIILAAAVLAAGAAIGFYLIFGLA
jgi:hypothetical protein